VFVCTPIHAIAEVARACLEAEPAAIVSDVGSVKTKVLDEVEARSTSRERSRFVGGHPMGGSERAGPEGASGSFVEGAAWVLTPAPWTDPDCVSALEAYLGAIGAHPLRMAADRHDRLVALVSHLPQVASSALMSLVSRSEGGDPDALALAATGFRDLTRLAGSDPDLWAGILAANRDALLEALDRFGERLRWFRAAVERGDEARIRGVLAEAARSRAELGAKPRVRAGVALVQVPVPDRPGVLAEMTAALGAGDVNIEDLQIVHSPWEPTGVVHLTVLSDRVDAALEVLAERGFSAVRVA
jgi:prephenate dehydrogenase